MRQQIWLRREKCELAYIYIQGFARSFLLHLLETSAHASDNLVVLFRSTLGPKLYGNLFYAKLYTVEKFTIGHVAAQCGRLNHITNACMCKSLTDHVILKVSIS